MELVLIWVDLDQEVIVKAEAGAEVVLIEVDLVNAIIQVIEK